MFKFVYIFNILDFFFEYIKIKDKVKNCTSSNNIFIIK